MSESYDDEIRRINDETNARLQKHAAAMAEQGTKQPAEDDRTSLLSYATDEEWDALEGYRDARAAAEAEQRKLMAKAAELERQAREAGQMASRRRTARRAAMVAVALGDVAAGDIPTPAPFTEAANAEDLQAAAEIARERAKEKGEEATRHHGALRGGVFDLIKATAYRAAEDYLETTRRLAALHTAIGGAQAFLSGFGNQYTGVAATLLVGPDWQDLVIPGSDALPALRGKGLAVTSLVRRLAGGDVSTCHRAAAAAHQATRAEIHAELGEWPFDRKV